MKIIYCAGCHQKVAEVEIGSKLKAGMVALCAGCETKRIAADMAMRVKGNSVADLFKGFGL